jgi:hypothetical protein
MSDSSVPPAPPASDVRSDERPRYRPEERFWPYPDLPERPDAEELAALDPDLRDALYGPSGRPFSMTLVFPRFADPGFSRALALARQAAECREVGRGDAYRVRARFLPSQPTALRDLFELVGPVTGCEVLVDDRPVPFARELWLPLVWFLIPR